MRQAWSARGRRYHPRRRRRTLLRKIVDVGLAFALLGGLALVSARLERFSTISPAGVARIADGDSLELGGERIRLRGIDAPELAQTCRRQEAEYPCGRLARDALRKLAGSGRISCEGWERDRYDRLLAVCSAGGLELNRELVALGWAVAYGGYRVEEAEARAARVGLWAGEFDTPGEWRKMRGALSEAPHDLLGAMLNWLRQLIAL
ncbi:thermonuclease family protein [Arvimicrobium flavum]|uniref:thermonuclease family protein n=1 Tax=Arvimicrobium flavum TaxID=3393320 RepID=UPI00237AC334|nr:thermonuclease family protein [Mesorhizobium shangrilense]